MDIKKIPVNVVGPGSQPVGEDGQPLSYIDMPSDMATFQLPQTPQPEAVDGLIGARDAMMWLKRALADYDKSTEPLLANLTALDDENRDLVNQILGEGEVSINFSGAFRARSQEAVLAGVWRTLYLDEDEKVCCDILEVADVPHTVRIPDGRDRAVNADTKDVPAELNNALAVLVELEAACAAYEDASTRHSINLTLLPLSDDDLEFVDERLGRGPVDTLSRAYGKCQVSSTLTPNVWWVRYYNSMGTLILNTLEVTDVPEAIVAAPEDLHDSAMRLDDILTPYWSDVA
jgi:hydrogenase-1 operon protein HyaF